LFGLAQDQQLVAQRVGQQPRRRSAGEQVGDPAADDLGVGKVGAGLAVQLLVLFGAGGALLRGVPAARSAGTWHGWAPLFGWLLVRSGCRPT